MGVAERKSSLVRLGVVLGCLLASAGSLMLFVYFYSSAGPPIDPTRIESVGFLRVDQELNVFSCLGGEIELAEIVPADAGYSPSEVVWSARLRSREAGSSSIRMSGAAGYDIEQSGPLDENASFEFSDLVTTAGTPGPYRVRFDNLRLSEGQALLGGGERLAIDELQKRLPTCALPAD